MPRNPFDEYCDAQFQPEETKDLEQSSDLDRLKGVVDEPYDVEEKKEGEEALKSKKPDFLGDISTADWQPKKRRDTRKRVPILFVRNIDDLREPLAKMVVKIGIPRDMLVRYLLEHGIKSHLSGNTELVSVLDQRLTLYPGETPPRKQKKRNSKGVGFRGIPEHTNQQITQIAASLGVPKWQVIRRFLETGIAGYKSKTITIQPRVVQTTAYTLYPDE